MEIFTPVDDDHIVDNPLEALVGDGKKFKTVEDLAKGKLEADRFVKKLEDELAELRGKAQSQATMEEIMTQIKAVVKPTPPNEPHIEPPKVTPATPDDIEQVVSNLFERKRSEDRLKSNQKLVEEKVLEKWGADAAIHINKKAKELGVELAYLQKVALDSPAAFFTLVGLNQTAPAPSPTPAPRSSLQAPPSHQSGQRTQSYYNDLKRRDPKAAMSREVQAQQMKDALQLGEAFFDA